MDTTVRIQGVKDARSYGNIKVTLAKTDTGDDLIRRPKDPGAAFGVTDVPRFWPVFDSQVKSGVIDVTIALHVAPCAAKKFDFKGSIDVVAGGKQTDVDVGDLLGRQAGEELKDEAFKAAGFKIILGERQKDEKTLRYEVEGDTRTLQSIRLVDASGKSIYTSISHSRSRTGGTSNLVKCSQKIPKDAKLRVTLYKGAKVVKLPFAFAGVELP